MSADPSGVALIGMDPGYEAPYFLDVAREVFDGPLADRGLSYVGDHRRVTACWASATRFLEVGYMPETMPRYELLLGVGEDEDPSLGPRTSQNGIGVWRLLPQDISPQIADWRFDGPDALRRELRRAWEQAVVPYVLPLWEQSGRLARLIAHHNDELSAEEARTTDDRLLRFARSEFDAGRFAQAANAYGELSSDALTRADQTRLDIARRRL